MDVTRERHFQKIKDDALQLAESIKTYLYNEGTVQRERWGEVAGEAAETAKAKWHEASELMQKKSRELDRYAREHTWQTAAVAAGIGALIGLLLSRPWKK